MNVPEHSLLDMPLPLRKTWSVHLRTKQKSLENGFFSAQSRKCFRLPALNSRLPFPSIQGLPPEGSWLHHLVAVGSWVNY